MYAGSGSFMYFFFCGILFLPHQKQHFVYTSEPHLTVQYSTNSVRTVNPPIQCHHLFTTLYGITFRWWQVVNYKIKNISEERLTQQQCTTLANHLHPLLTNPPAAVSFLTFYCIIHIAIYASFSFSCFAPFHFFYVSNR
jgi:hypothetical protein